MASGKAKRKAALAAKAAREESDKDAQGTEQGIIETPLYRAVITSMGGGIRSFKLKNYHESQEDGSPLVNMSSKVGGEYPLQTRFWVKGLSESVPFKFSSQ